MEATNNRITVLRKHLGINQSEFARKIGVTSQLVNKIEAGNAKLSEANIRLICFTFKVNEKWLREGKGEMRDDEALLSEYERRLLGLFRRLSPGAQKAFIEYVEKLVALATDGAVLCAKTLEGMKQAHHGEPPVGDPPLEPVCPDGDVPGFEEERHTG
jgi:transcriptional regulator with XRE-family HTH domain